MKDGYFMQDFKAVVKWLLTTKVFWAGVITFALLYAMFSRGNEAVAPTSISAASKKTPIYSVESKEKVVALSFDATWGNEDTQKILDILKENENLDITS